MELCSNCDRIDVRTLLSSVEDCAEQLRYEDGYYWHEQADVLCFKHCDSHSEITLSASAGCKLCKLIHDALECERLDADEVASHLPIVLHRGTESRIRVALDSPEEGLIKLCNLDISKDRELS